MEAGIGHEDLRVWITKSTSTDDDDDDTNKTYDFVLGEGQDAPRGVYPECHEFFHRPAQQQSG